MTRRADMSREAIERRLADLARCSAREPFAPRVDMSAAEVERRLRECAELAATCVELTKASGARAIKVPGGAP